MIETKAAERPMILTIICVILFLTAMMAMQVMMRGELGGYPRFFLYVYWIKIALTVVAVAGVYLMRRWGVVAFILGVIVGQAVQLKYGTINPVFLALDVIISLVFISYFKRMR
jgi:hypothetical protein